MKTNPDPGQRLARTARLASVETETAPPYGFETRVLAGWRSQRAPEAMPWGVLLRGAALCAGLLVLVSVVVSYRATSQSNTDELTLAQTVLARSYLP